ncbi:ribonuclease T2 [Ancylobacter lacus]|uniref:ribonuclease T2 n=1 Tax=Ancylobacter lacus TaxID=2579970 RepID=UPI001FEAB733|nr:ribonuclease T2 [Ancylobacter lacus]
MRSTTLPRLGSAVALALAGTVPGLAQQPGTPGRFDHYVLALSWSPSYCAAAGEKANAQQCGADARPYAFVVHGLWPQYASGWPQDCQRPAPFVPEGTVTAMLDLMPSRGLVLHQWRKHGTCSGLAPDAYFAAVRQARARLVIPEDYQRPERTRMVAPEEVERAFIAANPGLKPDMIAIACDGRRLSEVRICLDRGFGFTPCPEVDRRACRATRVALPPTRGG